jgi:hypothetical protein
VRKSLVDKRNFGVVSCGPLGNTEVDMPLSSIGGLGHGEGKTNVSGTSDVGDDVRGMSLSTSDIQGGNFSNDDKVDLVCPREVVVVNPIIKVGPIVPHAIPSPTEGEPILEEEEPVWVDSGLEKEQVHWEAVQDVSISQVEWAQLDTSLKS